MLSLKHPEVLVASPCKVPRFAGLVLINSAGLIRPKYKPEQNLTGNGNGAASALTIGSVAGPPAVLADAVSTALLFYLERTVARYAVILCPCHTAMTPCASVISILSIPVDNSVLSPAGMP